MLRVASAEVSNVPTCQVHTQCMEALFSRYVLQLLVCTEYSTVAKQLYRRRGPEPLDLDLPVVRSP